MSNFLKDIKDKVLVYDGSKGYLLQNLGMKGGECPEEWNINHTEEVKSVYSSYKEAGADVIQTNTFQGSRIKLEEYDLGDKTYELNYRGTKLAKEVMGVKGYVAASIGPLGILFEPSGELTFETAYQAYKEQVKAVAEGGADVINFETFTDLTEMRAALLAAKETVDIPVICSIAFEANGKTLMGTDPYIAAVVLKSLGADMIGTNCSLGPEHLLDIVRKMSEAGGVYLSVKPNAGLPELVNGQVIYKESAEKFAELTKEFVKYGARLVGGCCGTTPEFIKAIKQNLEGVEVPEIQKKYEQVITSATKLLNIEKSDKLNIGQLNAENDDDLFNELSNGNVDYVVDKVMELGCEGYDAIYINVDKVDGDKELLAQVVNTAQGYMREPFIIETKDHEALNIALRLYRGKAGVIVNGYSNEVMQELLITAKKYGSTIVDKSLTK
ncbi:MAG: homocysteine S-methyltransferase family protein [Clostridia bacterium]|nr:homocysteine S-methyltransferase family protein [Clostridia bacterium]